ncbi:hypothetical protein AAC387_Pa05g1231 [Persea americana]
MEKKSGFRDDFLAKIPHQTLLPCFVEEGHLVFYGKILHKHAQEIAALIGHTEDGWRQVRRELLQELLADVDNYKQLYGVENKVEELIETLTMRIILHITIG